MLSCERDAASVIMRDALDTCPLFSLDDHCLVSGCALVGALLVAMPVTNFSASSLSYESP